MDVDSIFKASKLATGSRKRKLSDAPKPESAKRFKSDVPLSTPVLPNPTLPKPKAPARVTVEDADDDEDEARNGVEDEEPEFSGEDEDGRFFGGGLTSQQRDILNIFDGAGGEGAVQDIEEVSLPGIRRTLLKLDRAINKNQDQRSKYPDDPTKFIDSEADLDLAIKALMPLSQVPALAYPEIVKTGTITMLVGLMSHENMDIVIDVVEVIRELTDEDVGGEADEDEDAEVDEETGQSMKDLGMKLLIDALLKESILELLVQNFGRFNEEDESDRQGLFHVLAIFENLLGVSPELAEQIVDKTQFLKWLLERVQARTHDENRGYASELLSILLQSSRTNRLVFAKEGGVEVLLQTLANYRKRDPDGAEEEEFMENLFDTLCSALLEPEIKKQFHEAEGVDLMLIMMKEKLLARGRAIKVLDHALAESSGTANCEAFVVEAGGLKTLFAAFMGKQSKRQRANPSAPASEETSHILGIIASLFTNLASESPARMRLLTKFVETNYEKVDRLLDVRESVRVRLKMVERMIEEEKKEMQRKGEDIGEEEDDEWYSRKLEGGLFTLQIVDYIIGWICMEDDGIRAHIQSMLARRDQVLNDVVDVLRAYHDNIAEGAMDSSMVEDERGLSQKMILEGLLNFLESC